MNQITTVAPQPPDLHTVERMKTLSPVLRGQYPRSQEEADDARRHIEHLSPDADPRWVAQRVVTLLTHFFVSDPHPAAIEKVAKDWIKELEGLPEWAIEAACQWWVSRHNPHRRKKPLPGDISERAHSEAAILTLAKKKIEQFERYGTNPPAFIAS